MALMNSVEMMKPKTLRPTKINPQLERVLQKVLRSVSRDTYQIIINTLFGKRGSKLNWNITADELANLFQTIGSTVNVVIPSYSPRLKSIFEAMEKNNRTKLSSALIDRVGVDLSAIIKKAPIQKQIQLVVDQNLSLIKSLTEKQVEAVKNLVYQDIRTGTFDNTKIRDFIMDEFGKSKRHADFIASDQTHKFNASLSQIRLKQLGIEEYLWRNAGDRRVRGNPSGLYPNSKYNHWSREGVRYRYDKPPPDGNPGQPIRCRCYAEPILPKSFDNLLRGK